MRLKRFIIITLLVFFTSNIATFTILAEDEKEEEPGMAETQESFSLPPDANLEVASQATVIDKEKKPIYSPLVIGRPIIAIPVVESEELLEQNQLTAEQREAEE